MPLKKKHTTRNRVIFWVILTLILALLIISFAPNQFATEIVLFP